MGNCLIAQEKIVQVMKVDGKILEYKAPIKVERILSDYAGHAVSDKISAAQHYLSPDAELLGGQLYYLLPLPIPPGKPNDNKRVGVSKQEVEAGEEMGVVRIKLVISRQKLQEMLCKGVVSVDDMVSQDLQKKQSAMIIKSRNFDSDSDANHGGWKPRLESIPEVN